MKLLIDLSACENLNWGVTVYALRILQGLKKNNYKDISLLTNEHIYEAIKKEFPCFNIIKFKACNKTIFKILKINRLIDSFKWRTYINNYDCDILFSPSANKFHFWKLKKRRVQTIHDLQGIKVYKGITKMLHKITTPLIIKNSNHIITISDYVKNDILKEYPYINKNKITTIYNSIILPQIHGQNRLESEKYILYVNALTEYKNVITLIKAYNQLITQNKINHKLIIIGSKTNYWNTTIIPFIKEKSLEDKIIQLENINNSDLVNYYSNADIFITTSLYEGFGFTPIEAAICKTPVISTTEGALKETTLNLLNYYSPSKNYNNLAQKIMEVLTKTNEEKLSLISIKLAENYDYIKQSEKIYKLLTNIYFKEK